MSLTDERALRSVIQIPGHTIAPPVTAGMSVSSQDLMVVSYLYGGIVPSIAVITSITSDILDYNAFIYRTKDMTTPIYQAKSWNAAINEVEDFEVER